MVWAEKRRKASKHEWVLKALKAYGGTKLSIIVDLLRRPVLPVRSDEEWQKTGTECWELSWLRSRTWDPIQWA